MRTALLACCAAAVLALAPAAAIAADEPSASKLDLARAKGEQALERYEAGAWAEAYALFREADETFHAPTLVLYMGRCQEKLGKLLAARALYEKVVTETLPAGATKAFREAQDTARAELAAVQKRIGRLELVVDGVPLGAARVTIDGAAAPLALPPREVDPGEHTVEARTEGAEPVVRTIEVEEGGSAKVELTLEPERQAGAVRSRDPLFVPMVAAFAAGGVGLVAGTITGIVSVSQVAELRARCNGNLCPAADEGAADTAGALGTVSTIAFIVGAAGVATGVTLLVWPTGGDAGEPGRAAALRARLGLGGMSLEGRF